MQGSTSLNLTRLADRFDEAAANGNRYSLDRMIDRLADKIQFGDDDRGRELEDLNGSLDRLGKRAREMGRPFAADNELIQRLRSAVLANADGSDGLRTALGEVPVEELIDDAHDLAARLRDNGDHEDADAVEAAIGELEKLAGPKRCDPPDAWEPPAREPMDVEKSSRDFEDAAADGDLEKLGGIIDDLARKVSLDGSRHDRSLDRLQRRLDRIGQDEGESGHGADSELIQRLRSAVLANVDGRDELDAPFGDAETLEQDANDLATRFEDSGRTSEANAIHAALRELTHPRRSTNERWL